MDNQESKESKESKQMKEKLSKQEIRMQEILEPFIENEDNPKESTLYEPVLIKIPIKNCQDKISSKTILEKSKEINKKETIKNYKKKDDERRGTANASKDDQSK